MVQTSAITVPNLEVVGKKVYFHSLSAQPSAGLHLFRNTPHAVPFSFSYPRALGCTHSVKYPHIFAPHFVQINAICTMFLQLLWMAAMPLVSTGISDVVRIRHHQRNMALCNRM